MTNHRLSDDMLTRIADTYSTSKMVLEDLKLEGREIASFIQFMQFSLAFNPTGDTRVGDMLAKYFLRMQNYISTTEEVIGRLHSLAKVVHSVESEQQS